MSELKWYFHRFIHLVFKTAIRLKRKRESKHDLIFNQQFREVISTKKIIQINTCKLTEIRHDDILFK